MIINTEGTKRQCMYCGREIQVGRIDKIFCEDDCRINHHNAKKKANKMLLPKSAKAILDALTNNYSILCQLNPEGKIVVPEKKMIRMGFDFEHLTNYHVTKKGDTYHYCFNQGYLKLSEGMVLLVTKDL